MPPEPTLPTDAAAVQPWTARRRLALTLLLGLALSIPVSILMGAIAEIFVAIAAVPVALVLTRDWYVTSAALSYGPFAAATSLLWLVLATGLWSVASPLLGTQRRFVAGVAGVIVVLLGYVLANYLNTIVPVTRTRELSLFAAWTPGGLVIAVIAGALAGLISMRVGADQLPPHNRRDLFVRLLKQLALFTFALALCLEGSVAALTALNWV